MRLDLKTKNGTYLILALGMTVAAVALIPRLEGSFFTGKYLWAEDGNVFLHDAHHLGLRSLWTPYAGYFHVYPRSISLVASFFELSVQPYVLLAGWAFAYALLVGAIIVRAIRLDASAFQACALILLVSLQPSFGEVFFNITNSQWILGAALTIVVLASRDASGPTSLTACLILLVLGLTGPFCMLIAPLLLIHGLVITKPRHFVCEYFIVTLCAAIQAGAVINSNRLQSTAIDPDLGHWLESFWALITFGAGSPPAHAAAALFWLAFLAALSIPHRPTSEGATTGRKVAALLLIAAIANIMAALYSSKANPAVVTAVGGGNRYTWVPYTLIFVGAVIASLRFRKVQAVIFLGIGAICYFNFHAVASPDLQFGAYANFARFRHVVIPIHPQWPSFPGWHVEGLGPIQSSESTIPTHTVELDSISGSGSISGRSGHAIDISSNAQEAVLAFEEPVSCADSSDVGVEIEISRPQPGWMQFFWSYSKSFSETGSTRRFYPAGEVKAQFAFPNSRNGLYARFDPLLGPGQAQIRSIVIYCLP